MPIDSQQRDDLDQTVYQARNTTVASLVCSQVSLVSASASIAATARADSYVVDTTSGSVTMTLPPLADVPSGRTISFYKPVAANSMVVDGYASETIEGAANETRTAQYAVVTVEKVQTAATTYAWKLHKADVTPGALADNSVTNAALADDAVDSAEIADGAIDLVHMSPNSVDSDQYVNGSIDPEHFATAAVVGATLGGGTRANAADTAVVLDAADGMTVVTISSTAGAGTRTITRGTLPVGVPVAVVMTAFDTNAYTAAVQGGTVTFNAVGEAGVFFWDGTALRFIAPGDVPATFA
jgi:hypothetical protein